MNGNSYRIRDTHKREERNKRWCNQRACWILFDSEFFFPFDCCFIVLWLLLFTWHTAQKYIVNHIHKQRIVIHSGISPVFLLPLTCLLFPFIRYPSIPRQHKALRYITHTHLCTFKCVCVWFRSTCVKKTTKAFSRASERCLYSCLVRNENYIRRDIKSTKLL